MVFEIIVADTLSVLMASRLCLAESLLEEELHVTILSMYTSPSFYLHGSIISEGSGSTLTANRQLTAPKLWN